VSPLFVLNVISTITTIVWLIMHYGNYAKNLDNYRDEIRASVMIQRMIDDSSFNIKVVLAILVAVQW